MCVPSKILPHPREKSVSPVKAIFSFSKKKHIWPKVCPGMCKIFTVELPKDTKIYCGHEYTHKNAEFCMKYDSGNLDLVKKFQKIKQLRSNNLPTIPTSLEDELKSNIFLRCDQNELKIKLNMKNQEDFKVFKTVRDLKDSF